MDNQRRKLIELIRENPYIMSVVPIWKIGEVADHLLANGVIVPPCKVGQTVYEFDYDFEREETYVVDTTVTGFAIITFEEIHSFRQIGKTVFLSREDAEKALEERKEK